MKKTTSALTAALLAGIAAVSAGGAHAAIKIENKALYDAYTGMLNEAKAQHWAEALAKAKEADAIQGKPAEVTRSIHENMVAYAENAKDYGAALNQLDRMIASGEGDKAKHISDALAISLQTNNKQKADSYAAMLGSNLTPQIRLYMAQGMAQGGRYKEAIAEVQPLMQGACPGEDVLRLMHNIYYRENDNGNRRATLEHLVRCFGKPQDWHDLLQLARNEKGLNDQQTMDIYRLRLWVGDLKTADDYQQMAQEAMVAEFPNEAKTVLDKANEAKLLNGERSGRLIKMANDSVAKDQANIADLQKRAAKDGDAGVKLGLILWTYGKNKEAEDAIRDAMGKNLADPDAAKVALGHALYSQDKKPEAIKTFDSVPKGSRWAGIARLEAIYAERGGETAAGSDDHHNHDHDHDHDNRRRKN